MATDAKRWTAEEVRGLIDESRHWPRYEVIDGELLVTPAPPWVHQTASGVLLIALDAYVREHAIGDVVTSPADIALEPGALVQPDLFVVPPDPARRAREWSEVRALVLAVETLSPGSARHDRTVKRRLYQRNGVPEYWIVDLDARLVERWRPGHERPEILDRCLEWRPDPASPSFVLDLPAFFTRVLER